VSFSIYGATLFLLYLISTLHHGLPTGRAKHVFHVLDHHAIYLLIAGSYTPFTLVTLDGSVGWWLFGAIWGMAVLGLVLAALPRTGCIWLLTGGLLYTSGIVFFALDHRYPWMHGMWHLFVLAGSISHYVAILVYV
jgi:hemolysin III